MRPESARTRGHGDAAKAAAAELQQAVRSPRRLSLELLSNVARTNVQVNRFHYTILVSAAASVHWQLAMAALRASQAASLETDAFLCSAGISACEHWSRATALLHAAQKWNEVLCGAALAKLRGRWEIAVGLLEPMVAAQVRCNRHMLSSLVAASWLLAVSMVATIGREIGLDSVAACAALGADGTWRRAARRQLGLHFRGGGESRSIFSCSGVVSACEKCAQWREALAVLGAGEASIPAQNAALSACEKAKQWLTALRLLEGEDVVTWTATQTAVSDNWELALGLATSWVARGWRLSALQLDALLRAAAMPADADADAWRRAAAVVLRHGAPLPASLASCVAACERAEAQVGRTPLTPLLAICWPSAAAFCSPDSCADCGQAECGIEPGCIIQHHGNFESYCVTCPNTTCLGDVSLDVTAGCSDATNVLVSLLMGIIGGLFAAGLPCCCLSIRCQELWAAEFLDETSPGVARVSGIIKEKKNHDSVKRGSSFSVIIDFEAQSEDGNLVPVRAHCASQPSFWSKVKVGQKVEVCYRKTFIREFVIVEDLIQKLMDTSGKYLLVIAGACFMVLGISCGFAAWPLTGCFLGVIPLAVMMVCGAVAGHFFVLRFAQSLTQRQHYVCTGQAAQSPIRQSSRAFSEPDQPDPELLQ
ncbi:unnamed protein product [Effrenium voratum]|nr:unnamed protein product [Effrenium voratum]